MASLEIFASLTQVQLRKVCSEHDLSIEGDKRQLAERFLNSFAVYKAKAEAAAEVSTKTFREQGTQTFQDPSAHILPEKPPQKAVVTKTVSIQTCEKPAIATAPVKNLATPKPPQSQGNNANVKPAPAKNSGETKPVEPLQKNKAEPDSSLSPSIPKDAPKSKNDKSVASGTFTEKIFSFTKAKIMQEPDSSTKGVLPPKEPPKSNAQTPADAVKSKTELSVKNANIPPVFAEKTIKQTTTSEKIVSWDLSKPIRDGMLVPRSERSPEPFKQITPSSSAPTSSGAQRAPPPKRQERLEKLDHFLQTPPQRSRSPSRNRISSHNDSGNRGSSGHRPNSQNRNRDWRGAEHRYGYRHFPNGSFELAPYRQSYPNNEPPMDFCEDRFDIYQSPPKNIRPDETYKEHNICRNYNRRICFRQACPYFHMCERCFALGHGSRECTFMETDSY